MNNINQLTMRPYFFSGSADAFRTLIVKGKKPFTNNMTLKVFSAQKHIPLTIQEEFKRQKRNRRQLLKK